MKKLKISELPISTTLKGLFTIGVDSLNRSVKVSLQFVEDMVNAAVSAAKTATNSANSAAQAATTAKDGANTAAASASSAASAANSAAQAANSSKTAADKATEAANSAAQAAQAAKTEADKATEAAVQATEETQAATKDTVQVTEEARAATEDTLAKIAILVPSSLTVDCIKRITWGNVTPVKIKAVLSPVTAMKNLIFLSDNRAVEVSKDGVLTPVAKGVSRVHVIPTMNTELSQTCLIEVCAPRLRLSSSTKLRFTQAGGLRLT